MRTSVEMIIAHGTDLAASGQIRRDEFGRNICTIDRLQLGSDIQTQLKRLEHQVQQRVTSEMRFTDSATTVQSCREVVDASIGILVSQLTHTVKTALFHDLNLIGFMFDRAVPSYRACLPILRELLDAVLKYKKTLSATELELWNASTYGGADQVPFFRGYLSGIEAASRK